MGTHTVVARAHGGGYDIVIVAANGSRHRMLGFPTLAEAEAWIAADMAADQTAADASVMPSSDD